MVVSVVVAIRYCSGGCGCDCCFVTKYSSWGRAVTVFHSRVIMLMLIVLQAIFVFVVDLLGYICLSLVIFCGCLRVCTSGYIFVYDY